MKRDILAALDRKKTLELIAMTLIKCPTLHQREEESRSKVGELLGHQELETKLDHNGKRSIEVHKLLLRKMKVTKPAIMISNKLIKIPIDTCL